MCQSEVSTAIVDRTGREIKVGDRLLWAMAAGRSAGDIHQGTVIRLGEDVDRSSGERNVSVLRHSSVRPWMGAKTVVKFPSRAIVLEEWLW